MAPKVVERKGTHLVHADDHFRRSQDVAPPISVTTTYLSPLPGEGGTSDYRNPARHVYSRYTQDNSTRAEHIISKLTDGFALTYSSGLAASFSALMFYRPKRIAITSGYHGCHATIQVYLKAAPHAKVIGIDDEFQSGDLCWLETPLNPTGESRDIRYYADKIHKVGGKILVDSTFAPPPLQHPFKFGADCILHSGTKYFGGHSDLLCGILVVPTKEDWDVLQNDRTYLGNCLGSLESWLLLRSLRTFHLRVPRQSETAAALVAWLDELASTPSGQFFGKERIPGGILIRVWHSSLQKKDERGFEPSTQMTGGWNPTFSIQLAKPEYAAWLPHRLNYFTPATSLGGVESLVEYRASWDPTSDPRAVRLSIGVEDLADLKADLGQALKQLVNAPAKL
ncbi:pyridoxal phosphate-dependent transferase [Roridomyces roridus]|uniref:Pyridoxal phosphate-dependent transferase n=1 Tax=Roridomyces roridus TaxID=1738132 RepID=A0AAD7C4J0_9AGAR|nr:pyridoxal phosphate-dependent transferase [Roridomyces roridus]